VVLAQPRPRFAVELDVRLEDAAPFDHLVADLLLTHRLGPRVLSHGAHCSVRPLEVLALPVCVCLPG